MYRFFSIIALAVFLAAPSFAAGPADVPRITVDELRGRLDKGENIVIVDVRSRNSYNASKVKIKGSVRIALDEINDRAVELPMGKELVTYCT